MRRLWLAALVLAAFVAPPIAARGASPTQDACQPDPTDPSPQVLHCRYGPLTVTPGTNLILFGPVTIESPRADGWVTDFKPDLVEVSTGEPPPIHEVHLHHGVWLSPTRHGLTPFFATGEEKTVSSIPPGYGYRMRPTDQWVLNYMLHEEHGQSREVFITWDVTWLNASSPSAPTKEVVPLWWDVVGGAYPVYDPAPDNSAPQPSACERSVVVADVAAPSGRSHRCTDTFTMDRDYEIVWTGGHIHPGGLRDELAIESRAGCTATPGEAAFTSTATPNARSGTIEPNWFGSWDYRMTVSPPDWRLAVHAGDRLSVTSVYDVGNPWYEAMGIMFAWAHPLATGEAPSVGFCNTPSSTTGDVTNVTPEAPVLGGTTPQYAPPAGATGAPVTSINVVNFDYIPGGKGQTPAPVAAGSTVTFRNVDAAASVFHTVTQCAYPCNREHGQSYPLAIWGFDSGELGYGPPGATAAKNDASWRWKVPSVPPGTVLTYFCRIHPGMRGSVEVVQ